MGQETDWAAQWTAGIGEQVSELRRSKGMSAQLLSDRCSDLGLPIPRSTIANLEGGRRTAMPVHELVVIARALDVAPVTLLYPPATPGEVEPLPGVHTTSVEAIEWFSGERRLRTDASYDEWIEAGFDNAPDVSEDRGAQIVRAAITTERQLVQDLKRQEMALDTIQALDAGLTPMNPLARHPSRRAMSRDAWGAYLRAINSSVESAAESLRGTREAAAMFALPLPPLTQRVRDLLEHQDA